MDRWKAASALLVLALLLLAGCTAPPATIPEVEPSQSAPTPVAPDNATVEPEPAAAAPSPPTTITSLGTGCTGMTFVILVDMETARKALPSGFFAADAAQLIDIPGATSKAAFVAVWLACDEATNETEPVTLGALGVFITHPTFITTNAYRDFYMVEHWEDWPTLTSWLDQWGFPKTGTGSPVLTTHLDGRTAAPVTLAPDPGPSIMVGEVGGDPSSHITGTLGGTTGYNMDGKVFRFWHDGADELLWLDIVPDRDATGSAGQCEYGPDSVYATWTLETSCGEQGTLGISLPSADITFRGSATPRQG